MTSIEIVAYSIEHVAEVSAIEAVLNPEQPWSQKLFADELTVSPESRHWLVAVDSSEVVGFAGSMLVENDAHLMNIGVKPSHQRMGVANALMVRMIADARDMGFAAMTLEVRPNNERAIAMYRKFGFAPEGVRKSYYPDGQDAMIMWLHEMSSTAYGRRLKAMAS